MRRIDTLEDLKAEKKRLVIKRLNLEREIKNDFEEIRQSFEPVNLIASSAKKALGTDSNHLLGNSVGEVTNMIARTVLRNSGLLPRILVPLIVKTVTSKLVEKNKSKIFDWIGTIALRVSGKKTAGS
ncbi:MAG: hypothetical protein ACXVNO_07660 [Bacteroidia bacterium]